MPIDPQALYGEFIKSSKRKAGLQEAITRKSLNLPAADDDMQINVSNGLSGWQLVAAIGLLVAGIAGGYYASQQQAVAPPVQIETQIQPTKYRVIISDENGPLESVKVHSE